MTRHDTDPVSFAFGLVFLGFVAWWLFVGWVDVELPDARWVLASVLVAIGLLGVVHTLRGHKPANPR